MGAPLDIVKRKTIVSRKLAGESLLDISISMCIPYSSILAIWKRYKVGGLAHLAADYSACGKGNSLRYSSLKPFCLQVKQEHPRWGAARLLLEVEKAFLTVKLPQVRTLQQWYKEVGLNRPLSKKGKIPTRMATSVHSIWQVDAKENIDLGKQYACYLTIVDQNSGAGLDSIVFPYKRISQVPLLEIQGALLKVFERWGHPLSMRVDNGYPFGSPKSSPTTALALWLIAHGIDMIFNTPFCPKENAKVEKMQDTTARWAEIQDCKNLEQLQINLQQAIEIQRQAYKVTRLGNRTRCQAFPELNTLKHPFSKDLFQEQKVYRFLEQQTYVRKVSSQGQLSHFGYKINGLQKYHHQYLTLKWHSQKLVWNIYDTKNLITTVKALYLSKEKIMNMTIFQRT